MRRRRLKKLIKRLHELRQQKLTRDQLLIKLGAARKEAGPAAWRIIDLQLPDKDQVVTPETFCFGLNWQRLREARRREGSYLLRSNVTGGDPAQLWAFYLQLVEVEQAFKELKGDLAIRPIYHQTDERIEAHIFVAFLAYCLQVTLKQRLRSLAPGLTPRSVLDKMAAIQMVDVQLPTTDGRTVILSRYTEPEADQAVLLHQMKMQPARSAATQDDLRGRSTIAMTRRHVVPTFTAPIPENRRSARFFPSSSERTGSVAQQPATCRATPLRLQTASRRAAAPIQRPCPAGLRLSRPRRTLPALKNASAFSFTAIASPVARIAPDVGVAPLHRESAETTQLDAAAIRTLNQ